MNLVGAVAVGVRTFANCVSRILAFGTNGVGGVLGIRLHRVGDVLGIRLDGVSNVLSIRLDVVSGLLLRALVARCESSSAEGHCESGRNLLHRKFPVVVEDPWVSAKTSEWAIRLGTLFCSSAGIFRAGRAPKSILRQDSSDNSAL